MSETKDSAAACRPFDKSLVRDAIRRAYEYKPPTEAELEAERKAMTPPFPLMPADMTRNATTRRR